MPVTTPTPPTIREPAAPAPDPSRYAPHTTGESRMMSLIKRLCGSAVLIALVLGTLFAFPLWIYPVVIAAFVTAGLYEFFTMVRHRGILVHRPLGVALGIVFIGLVAWRSMVEPGLVPTPVVGQGATAINWMWDVFWPATIVIIFIRQFTRENTFEALGGLATTLFGLAYVAALFSYFLYLRAMKSADGAWLVTYLILVTKMGDAGAYAVGNLVGRHTLVQRISPKKTVEGFFGAVLVSTLTAMAAQPMLGSQPIFGQPPSPWLCGLLGLILGIVGQLGDLAESLLKRDCQVKDSGSLIPGLGGVLDVMDSLLFTAPLFYGLLIYG
ncbi:MAG: phosphatidate cytidylyltransferase [Candidatus Omnitrophica bacterium]|nr:phosphatidate cytidylyltransferase [Candidatus Omnitrophota bacterium]